MIAFLLSSMEAFEPASNFSTISLQGHRKARIAPHDHGDRIVEGRIARDPRHPLCARISPSTGHRLQHGHVFPSNNAGGALYA